MRPRPLPLVLTSLALAACATAPPPAVVPPTSSSVLPSGLPELLAEAEASYSRCGPRAAVERSLAAARRALAAAPANDLAARLGARAALWLLELGGLDEATARALAAEGEAAAALALGARPDHPETVFLAGALLGQRLRLATVPSLGRLAEVHAAFARSVELDPDYDDGAPLRALGTLLVRAPQWPSGIGDAEAGLELLARAAERFPAHPANHLYLAEGLIEEGEPAAATAAARRVEALCAEPRWQAPCDTYLPRARAIVAAD